MTTLDPHLVSYVINYYSHFMTEQEKMASRHFFGIMKATKGAAMQRRKRKRPRANTT